MKEEVIDFVLDLIITLWGELTGNRKKQMEENISLYVNDYTIDYIERHKLNLTSKEIDEIIEEVINQFRVL